MVLASTSCILIFLLTLEALYIGEIKPGLDTKEEYRSQELNIKF